MGASKRSGSSKSEMTRSNEKSVDQKGHSHNHSHSHGDGHDHDHSHGIFHTHAHDHSEGAEQLIKAISAGKLDRGTKITLLGMSIGPYPWCRNLRLIIGLGSNVALTISKGLAGLWMNSASLLAEAGHSLSDLLGVSE